MVNIIKEESPIEEHLQKKLELICEFAKTTPTIILMINVVNEMYDDNVSDSKKYDIIMT